MKLYAWIGTDRTGTIGVLSVQTPIGVAPAVFAKQQLAEQFTDQAQARADMLGVNVELTVFETDQVLTTLTPRSN